MRNRWYDPNTGRFTQQDPIGFAGGSNLYGYTGGDPVTFSDPTGLCPILRNGIPCFVSWGLKGLAYGAIGGAVRGFAIGLVTEPLGGELVGAVGGFVAGGAAGGLTGMVAGAAKDASDGISAAYPSIKGAIEKLGKLAEFATYAVLIHNAAQAQQPKGPCDMPDPPERVTTPLMHETRHTIDGVPHVTQEVVDSNLNEPIDSGGKKNSCKK
jgi:hypothetical protein